MTYDFLLHVGPDYVRERLDKYIDATVSTLTRTRVKALITAGDIHIGFAPYCEVAKNEAENESIDDDLGDKGDDTLDLDDDATEDLQNHTYTGSLDGIDFVACTQPSKKLKQGDIIAFSVPAIEEAAPEPEEMDLDIVFEDAHVIVINKAAGIVVHPGAGNVRGTLINGLLHHCGPSLSGIGGVARPGIVHRLDKGTSGLMVVAKNDVAHQFLSKQFVDRSIKRTYFALCWGIPNPPEGKIKANIGRDPRHRQRMKVLGHRGKEAITNYYTHEKVGMYAGLIECNLETGRTHQIRVHMTHKGSSLIGDPMYGRTPRGVDQETKDAVKLYCKDGNRPLLHAGRLSFIHPETKEIVKFETDLPQDFEDMYTYLKSNT